MNYAVHIMISASICTKWSWITTSRK